VLAEFVKLEHSIFALPLAYLTMFLVSNGQPEWGLVGWVSLAMVGLRNFGMAINRIVDSALDARNPRTVGRPLPAGRLKYRDAYLFLAVTLAGFLVGTYFLSPLCLVLCPIPTLLTIVYPYLKRFTWVSHVGLGLVYGCVPTGVWLAVTNELPLAAWLLGIAAGAWATGFDIIFGCMDVEVDREQRLHSMPADLGLKASLAVSWIAHIVAVALLIVVGIMLELGLLYYVGTAIFLLVLIREHFLISPTNLTRAQTAFFNMNGLASVMLSLFGIADTIFM